MNRDDFVETMKNLSLDGVSTGGINWVWHDDRLTSILCHHLEDMVKVFSDQTFVVEREDSAFKYRIHVVYKGLEFHTYAGESEFKRHIDEVEFVDKNEVE